MNPAAALMYNSQSINWDMVLAYYVSGLPMDLIHAGATVIFILIAAKPMLEKLDRIKVKYGFVE
jgi:energy-coupling factor transport system ATP-binding protein